MSDGPELRSRVKEFLENSDPRPPYVEDKGKRSAAAGVLGLLLIPTFFLLVYFAIPGFVHTSGQMACLCASTPTARNQWLFDLTAAVQKQGRHFPVARRVDAFDALSLGALCAVRYATQEANVAALLSPAKDACADALLDVEVTVRPYSCPGLRTGDVCSDACRVQSSAWTELAQDPVFSGLGCDAGDYRSCALAEEAYNETYARQMAFWRHYEQRVCANAAAARWCQAVSASPANSEFSLDNVMRDPDVQPLCQVPAVSGVVLGIGSVFGLLMGAFVNAPAGARLIWLRIRYRTDPAAESKRARDWLRELGTGVRNVALGLFWFGFLYTVMAESSTRAQRLGAQLALSTVLTFFPWDSYFEHVFGDMQTGVSRLASRAGLTLSLLWLAVNLARCVVALSKRCVASASSSAAGHRAGLAAASLRPRLFERCLANRVGYSLDLVLTLTVFGYVCFLVAALNKRGTALKWSPSLCLWALLGAVFAALLPPRVHAVQRPLPAPSHARIAAIVVALFALDLGLLVSGTTFLRQYYVIWLMPVILAAACLLALQLPLRWHSIVAALLSELVLASGLFHLLSPLLLLLSFVGVTVVAIHMASVAFFDALAAAWLLQFWHLVSGLADAGAADGEAEQGALLSGHHEGDLAAAEAFGNAGGGDRKRASAPEAVRLSSGHSRGGSGSYGSAG